MTKLRTILQYKYSPLLLLIVTLLISFIRCNIDVTSKYNLNETNISGIIISKTVDGNKLSFIIKGKEKVKCTYIIQSEEEKNKIEDLNLGVTILLKGSFNEPDNNTIPNTFNYKKYLKYNHINYLFTADSFEVINNKTNILYLIKNKLINKIKKYKSKEYLLMFILGDKSLLDDDIYNTYQNLNVSHIFAISGLHVSIMTGILITLLKRIKENIKYFIIIVFLIFYLYLVSFQASVVRSVVLFSFLFLNKKLILQLDTIDIYYLSISFILLIEPYFLMNIGFQYSSIISYSLIRYNKVIKGNYILKCLKISLISFLFSLPITINNNYQINILGVFNNLFFVPFISFIIYPLCLMSLIIPYIDNLLYFLLSLIESISNYLLVYNIIIAKLNIVIIIIYYVLLYLFFNTYNKKILVVIFVILACHKMYINIDPNFYVYYLDVGQGDSSLILYKGESILIDTGGSITYETKEWAKRKEYHITDNTIIFLKSLGITKLDAYIISHGDTDHMGDSINLVNNFKIDKVIFNCGDYNDLENELIEILKQKNIKYYTCIHEFKLNNYKLINLNTTIYDNENDNSNVIYLNYKNYKFLFMGDASTTREKDILENYNISNIDFLKVGHHGSDTSTSEEFIKTINPKYSLISVGENNRYGHPKESVLDILEKNNSKIYRTDKDGSLEIKIKNDEYSIETCDP